MKQKPTARLHHYLPQAYLASFTDSGTKHGQFFVLDVESGRSFRTSPKNVAAERDFNRIAVEGLSPDCIEQSFAPFEQSAVEAIYKTIASGTFPNDQDCNWILNLLGLIAVRHPQRRGSFNRSREEAMHLWGLSLVSDKKTFDHHVQMARAAGEEIDESVPFEQIKQFVEQRRYRIEFSPGSNLCIELQAFDKLLPILGQRTWSVLIAPEEGPEFICCDDPVTLVWKNRRRGPVGFGLKKTEVFFPLGRRVGFYGTFEEFLPPVVHLKAGYVATMNKRIAANAERYVFSTLDTFSIWHQGATQKVHCGRKP